MMAPQNQCYPQNQYSTFSAACAVAPVVLWSERSEGNVYLAAKNTFLEFYTEERKAIKRHACARSASCDSSFKDIAYSAATDTTRSPSPSQRSISSGSIGSPKADLKSPGTPRSAKPRNANFQQFYHQDASYDNYDLNGTQTNHTYDAGQHAGVHPMVMVPMMMPMAMPRNNEAEQEAQRPKAVLPPKKQDLKELNTEPVEEITTLMIRGIPCSFSQDTLMKLIDNAGLKGRYDFFYLPRAGNNGSNLGYAFINFTDAMSADHCMATYHGVPLDPSRSMKVCTISAGDIQGLANLRKHFRRTAVSRGSRGPVFLKVFSGEESQQ